MERIEEIVIAVISAGIYALSGYLKSAEQFNAVKAIATLITGGIIGIILTIIGVKVTEENVIAQMSGMIGLLYLVESVIKGIARRFGSKENNR